MANSQSIYEDFVLLLFKNDLISNYTAEYRVLRKFYVQEYKHIAKSSFYAFSLKLWQKWFITDFRKKFVYFDQRWLNHITQRNKETPFLKRKIPEDTLCNPNYCQLCLIKFSSNDLYKSHIQSLKHKIRVEYIKNKDKYENEQKLKLQLVEDNNTDNSNTDNSLVKLKYERKVNTNAKILLINKDKSTINVVEIVNLNPYQKDMEIQTNLGKGNILESGKNIDFSIKGYFKNSKSFTLPVAVVCKSAAEKNKYFIKDILVDVASEFNYLKSNLPYVKSTKPIYPLEREIVIPSDVLVLFKSNYREVFPLDGYHTSPYLVERLRRLIITYPNFIERHALNGATKYFFKRYCQFLRIEPSLTKSNYYNLLNTLLSIEEQQVKVDVRHYDSESKLTIIGANSFELEVPGLSEARPSLVVHDSVFVKERRNDKRKYQGIVSRVQGNLVRLNFNYKFAQIFDKEKKYHIEFGYNRRPIRVQKQAVLLAHLHNIIPYFFPEEHSVNGRLIEEIRNEELEYFNPKLNEEQKRAVANILNEIEVPYLIFGPPGTGKTITIVESILQIWKTKPNSKILVCAPSNTAINEIASRLVNNLPATDLFRLLGNTYGQERKHAKIEHITNIQDGQFYIPSMEEILKYRVLLTTLVTAARLVNGGIPDGHYSHVFIDESGYATESETLLPIAGILSNSMNMGKVNGQIVLAGDPRQLGPVVHSNFVQYCGYGISMLERLLDTCQIYARNGDRKIPYNEKYVTKLVRNYRSHEAILKIPNMLFYHNELIPTANASSNIFSNWEHLLTPDFPVIFHHVVGEDGRENNSPSFFNIQEIEEVVEYIRKLLASYVCDKQITEDDIGIVTPYRKQVFMLQKVCEKEGWNNLLVGTVEQFQGKEKLITIISTVRSKNFNKYEEIDVKYRLGFLRSPKRFNVALTRAKAMLIVVGNGDVLKNDKNWIHFLAYCLANQSVAGEKFFLSDENYFSEETEVKKESTNKVLKEIESEGKILVKVNTKSGPHLKKIVSELNPNANEFYSKLYNSIAVEKNVTKTSEEMSNKSKLIVEEIENKQQKILTINSNSKTVPAVE